MKMVYVCSPLRGDIDGNIRKAHKYCKTVISMGAVPIAPHTIFTKYLDDRDSQQREQGLQIGLEILLKCDELWFFGTEVSEGMEVEIRLAKQNNIPVYPVIDPDNPLCYPTCPEPETEQISFYTDNLESA